jgi:hypothetical protein
VPSWLLEILDPLPLPTAAMYFSLFFLVVAWTGVIFVRPFFRLWLRGQPRLNEVVTAASAGFYLFYGLLLGLLSVAAYSNARDISGFAGREAAELVSIYRSTISYPEGVREEVRHLLRDYTVYVVDREWPAYQEGRVPLGGYNRLQAIRETLLAFEPQTRTQEIAHSAVLKAFNDMVTLHCRRVRHSGNLVLAGLLGGRLRLLVPPHGGPVLPVVLQQRLDGGRLAAAAEAHFEFADQADEVGRLRHRVSV